MVRLAQSVAKNGQSSYLGDNGGSNTSSGTYVDFYRQRERLVSLLEKETREEQIGAETICEESSSANHENM